MRECMICGEEKPLNQFGKYSRNRYRCNTCHTSMMVEVNKERKRNTEARKAQQQQERAASKSPQKISPERAEAIALRKRMSDYQYQREIDQIEEYHS